MSKHIRQARLGKLPASIRSDLKSARLERGWSQLELGRRTGLPQVHISAIETGKVVPRFDTLLDLARVLGFDLVLVPRALVPAVQSLVRDYRRGHDETHGEEDGERLLYGDAHAFDDDNDGEEEPRGEGPRDVS